MQKYRIYRRVKGNEESRWLSTAVGDIDFIMTLMKSNLTDPKLSDYEYRVSRYG